MVSIPKTRSHFESILGFPAPLPLRQLATNRNIVNCYHYQRRIMDGNSTSCFIAKRVANEVISIWEFAGLPTMLVSSVSKKIQRLVERYQKVSNYQQINEKMTHLTPRLQHSIRSSM